MQWVNGVGLGIVAAVNLLLMLSFYSDPTGTKELVRTIIMGVYTLNERLVEILAELTTQIFLVVFSLHSITCMCLIMVMYAVWNNWDETKRVTAQLWLPVLGTCIFLGVITTQPEKIIIFLFIVFIIQASKHFLQ